MKPLRKIRTEKLEQEAPEFYQAVLNEFDKYGGIYSRELSNYYHRICVELRKQGYNTTNYRIRDIHIMLNKDARPDYDLHLIHSLLSREE